MMTGKILKFALRNTEKVEDIQVKSERLMDSSDDFKGRAAMLCNSVNRSSLHWTSKLDSVLGENSRFHTYLP